MKRVKAGPVYQSLASELVLLLGEELKYPLVSIAQINELTAADPRIEAHVQNALRVIDTVLLYKRFASGQLELTVEPVHVGSVITTTANTLKPYMGMVGYRAEIDIQHGLKPVSIDRRLFCAGFVSLWQAFIGSIENGDRIICSARAADEGHVRLSLLCENNSYTPFTLSRTNTDSSQPISGQSGSAVDILAAQGIFALAGVPITQSRRKNVRGVGVTLPVSRQTRFV